MTRVGLCLDPVFGEHDAGAGHPERPERLEAVRRGLRDGGLEKDLVRLAPRAATPEELLRVHTAAHVDRLAAAAGRHVRFDPDTAAGPRSHAAALAAAGAVADAVGARPRRLARPGLLRGAPPGPPRDARPGHGLLPAEQRGDRRGGGPRPRAQESRRRRLRRPPRERHAGGVLAGPAGPLRLLPPVPLLPRHGCPRRGGGGGRAGLHRQPARCRPGRTTASTDAPIARSSSPSVGRSTPSSSSSRRASTPTGTTRSGAWA